MLHASLPDIQPRTAARRQKRRMQGKTRRCYGRDLTGASVTVSVRCNLNRGLPKHILSALPTDSRESWTPDTE